MNNRPDQAREAFEKWAISQDGAEPDEVKRDDIGWYKYNDVKYGWKAYQAGLSAGREQAAHGESIAISSGMKLNKRRCEICKVVEGPGVECVSPFTLALRHIGITTGDYAHPACLKKAQKAFGSSEKAIT